MRQLPRYRLLAALTVIALGTPMIGAASIPGELEKSAVKVSYKDLDINSKDGAQTLYARLKTASRDVCGVGTLRDAGSLKMHDRAQACYDETLGKAVDRIDSKALKELHAG